MWPLKSCFYIPYPGIMEYWNVGMLECWVRKLDYILVKPKVPVFHASIIPFKREARYVLSC
jgi:predicted acetyltransferase